MALYECDLALKKMRVYRDSTELLFFAQPQVKQVPYGAKSPNITVWRLPFTTLDPSEKSSLRILSPGMTLLHAEWTAGELFTEIAQKVSETEPVRPLSLPPPKRLSEEQKRVPKSQENWALVSNEIRQAVLKSITDESQVHEQHSPNSLKSINRQLQISETLNQLQERWRQVEITNQLSDGQKQGSVKHESIQSDQEEMLCLYFQNQQNENALYSHTTPKITSGAWIDSIPPTSLTETVTNSAHASSEKQGLWLRLLIQNVYWTPSLVLSLHGDTGRLNVMATLQAPNLSALLKTVLHSQTNEHESEIKLEWINHNYHQSLKDVEVRGESQDSVLALNQLLSLNTHSAPKTCFKSLLLMSRSLRDLEGEVALVQSLKRLNLSDTTPNGNQSLGYFCDFIRYKYPPALTLGEESALDGQREIRLCLPKLDPFLDDLLDAETNRYTWEIIVAGVGYQLAPIKRHGSLLHFLLETSQHLLVERLDQGLKFLSQSSQHCRIGVLSIDGDQVIDELELAPLGTGILQNLEHSHDTLELVHQPSGQSDESTQELWPED